MREINVKAKSIVGRNWLYGSLVVDKATKNSYITTDHVHNNGVCDCVNCYEVDRETVSLSANQTDKNGIDVYEHDIVVVTIEGGIFKTVVTWGANRRGFSLKCDRSKIEKYGQVKYYSIPASNRIEVIGNIFDNPELLK